MKSLPGYLLTLLLVYIAVSVWYDNEIHRIVHTTVFGMFALLVLGVGVVYMYQGRKK